MKEFIKQLSEFVKFKSVSTDAKFKDDIEKTARWLASQFESNGFKAQIVGGYDNPIVVASLVVSPKLETCLVYGHYDVQPAEKNEGWDTEPFTLTEKNGRLYARGAVDNKGQVFAHMFTVFKLLKAGKLNYNVKFIIEGNEETGSPSLAKFVKANISLLKADFVMLSDGEITAGHPTIELGFRGVLNTTIKLTVSDRDLHSGLFGGTTPNAADELTKLLTTMFYGPSVNIPRFYDDVKKVPADVLAQNKKLPYSKEYFEDITGTCKLVTEAGYGFHTQVSMRPSAEITGLRAGYTGEGYRNSIPGSALAKVNFRLTAEQDPKRIAKLVATYVKKITPKYAKVEVEFDEASYGVKLDVNNKYVEKAKKCLKEAYGSEVLLKYCGATLPIVAEFQKLLGIPQVLAPLANEDCRMHATNENFEVKLVENSLKFSKLFFGS